MTQPTGIIQKLNRHLEKIPLEFFNKNWTEIIKEIDYIYEMINHSPAFISILDNQLNLLLANKKVLNHIPKSNSLPFFNTPLFKNFETLVNQAKQNKQYLKNFKFMTLKPETIYLVNFGPLKNNTYFFHVEDITAILLEQKQKQDLEHLHSMNFLAGGLAHELKNPIGAIDLHLNLIRFSLEKESIPSSELKENLEIIDEEVQKMNHFIQTFLTAIRPFQLNIKSYSVKNCINLWIHKNISLIKRENIHIQTKIQEHIPEILIDLNYFHLALDNLLKNSIEAQSTTKPHLSIDIEAQENTPFIELRFSDNALGIPESALNQIFTPYFTTKIKGTGVGLTFVHKIMLEHQGNIKIEHSKEDEGSTFLLFIPYAPLSIKKFITS